MTEATKGERWKTLFLFAGFGLIASTVLARLVWLQAVRAEPNRRSVEIARDLHDHLPAMRGSILDRHGRRLAYDRPVLDVQAEFLGRVQKGAKVIPVDVLDTLATRLTAILLADEERADRHDPVVRQVVRTQLFERLRSRKQRKLASNYKAKDYIKIDFLLKRDLDSLTVVERLRAEARHWNREPSMPGRLYLRFVRSYRRTYPDREATYGPVGNYYIAKQTVVRQGRRKVLVPTEEYTGLEACRGLWSAGGAASGNGGFYSLDFRDSKRRRFWSGIGVDPQPPSTLRSTLDLELQKAAHAELKAAAAAVRERYKSDYEWGALVLVDIPSGDVLAMASHYPGRQTPGAFAPLENSFEPGSVVKPLVVALALERSRVGWHDEIDCTPTHPRHGRPVDGHPRRIIYDDHRCEVLTPHGILMNSSNIGAVRIGTRLSRAEWKEYLTRFGFCRRTDLGIPGETPGYRPGGIAGIDRIPERKLGRWTAPSLSFGYELNVTAVQLARAYLTLLSGRERELRLVADVTVGGRQLPAKPASQAAERFLSEVTVRRVRGALQAVVSADEHATGRHLHAMLDKLGHPQPLIAGKTGTSDSGIGGVRSKTAAFVGYAPALAPRYLVVCVLRKDRAARFYGGSYAAPSAGRLLLEAMRLEKERRPLRSEQVSAWSGARGLSSEK